MPIVIDEILRKRIERAVTNLSSELKYLNSILGPTPVTETHKILPGFREPLVALRKQLTEAILARTWLETLPPKETLEDLEKIVVHLSAALVASENLSRK